MFSCTFHFYFPYNNLSYTAELEAEEVCAWCRQDDKSRRL